MHTFEHSGFNVQSQVEQMEPPGIAVAGIVQAIEMLSHKFQKLETAVEKMAEAVSRLAVMEERQLADRQAVERAFQRT